MEASNPGPVKPVSQHTPLLLLHVCCGPCAAHVIDLLKTAYHPVCFFFNPNIHPDEEFYRRLRAAAQACKSRQVALWVPSYHPAGWFERVTGLEDQPEGGKRCTICFRFRLELTAQAARLASIPFFTTTLTVSPHKKSIIINEIGNEISKIHDIKYLSYDFKKKNGFKESMEKSKKLGLYRQRSCGCTFSTREEKTNS